MKMNRVTFTIARNGAILRDYEKEAFEAAISADEILPTDDYWTEGMADWEFVRDYRVHPAAGRMAQTVKMSQERMAQTIKMETTTRAAPTAARRSSLFVNETPASIGGICALIGAFCPLISPLLIFVSIPLLISAFALAILSMAKGRIGVGIALMIGTFIAGPTSCTMFIDRDRLLSKEGRNQIIEEGRRTDHARSR